MAAMVPGPRSSAIEASSRTPWLGDAAVGGSLIRQPTSRTVPSRLTLRPQQPAASALAITLDRAACRSTLDRNRLGGSNARMRSETAVRKQLLGAAAIENDHRRAFPQLNSGVVGLAGLEPAASSLSATWREPLCQAPFSQVTLDRSGRSYVLSPCIRDVPLAASHFLA
jgi:hypothetical protein